MAKITILPVFSNKSLSAGDAGTSQVFDLRYNTNKHLFSLASTVTAGTAGTTGTTVLSYVGCHKDDGTFVAPSGSVAIGTYGTALASDIVAFTPPLVPFMKIIAAQAGEGTDGFDSKVEAALIVQ